jgi:hypothetical protein
MPDCPGVTAVRYAPKTDYLYYTSTMKELFMRVRIDPKTHESAGEPEFVAGGRMADDFCIDENAGDGRTGGIEGLPLIATTRRAGPRACVDRGR